MADKILNVIWFGFMVWSCLAPEGYGPYVLLGFNGGDLLVTLYCGLRFGYLKEDGDFRMERFITSVLGFALLGGFYVGKISFQPGSDPYACALYFTFASFWLTFGYRLFQYGIIHVLNRDFDSTTDDEDRTAGTDEWLEDNQKSQDLESPSTKRAKGSAGNDSI